MMHATDWPAGAAAGSVPIENDIHLRAVPGAVVMFRV
jgi:hypothetical protein